MRKLFTIILLLSFIGNDDALGQINYANIIPAVTPTFWWRCSTGDSLINTNKAIIVSGGDSIVFDSLPYMATTRTQNTLMTSCSALYCYTAKTA